MIKYAFVNEDARNVYEGHVFSPATALSAGVDLLSVEDKIINPGCTALIGLGLQIDPGVGGRLFGLLCLRSSTPRKIGGYIPNGIGVIDMDYRGQLFMQLTCPSFVGTTWTEADEDWLMQAYGRMRVGGEDPRVEFFPALIQKLSSIRNDNPIKINKGDRLAQLIIVPTINRPWVNHQKLSDTNRGTGGFGSTDK